VCTHPASSRHKTVKDEHNSFIHICKSLIHSTVILLPWTTLIVFARHKGLRIYHHNVDLRDDYCWLPASPCFHCPPAMLMYTVCTVLQQHELLPRESSVVLRLGCWTWKSKDKGPVRCTGYSASYMSHIYKHFKILKVAAYWHELMTPQHTMQPYTVQSM